MNALLPHYDRAQSYDWNYDHVPHPIPRTEPPVPGTWTFCGLPVQSPLGIAAGPLLNGRWILYYASLGFDVLTYKTVRSRARACYELPNLQPVRATEWHGGPIPLLAQPEMTGSWAVSFGMPSRGPEIWRADIQQTRKALPAHKVLSVSVVATPEPNWTLADVAEDFARCAAWACQAGADAIEANFSCPNVASADAQLYQHPESAGIVAARLRSAVGSKPLLLKMGHVTDETLAAALCRAVSPHVDALVMVNCITASVSDGGLPLFHGERRGIAGAAIRQAALDQIRLFTRVIRQSQLRLQLVGVGGIGTAEDVRAHLAAGAHGVQLATSAMLDPAIGLTIRAQLGG